MAAHAQEIVRAAVVRVVPVGVDRVAIAGEYPVASERVFRRRATAPVEGRGRRTAHQQIADLVRCGRLAVRALHARVVSGDHLTLCTRTGAPGEVRDGDVAD